MRARLRCRPLPPLALIQTALHRFPPLSDRVLVNHADRFDITPPEPPKTKHQLSRDGQGRLALTPGRPDSSPLRIQRTRSVRLSESERRSGAPRST